jgi:hypothetical protein
MGWQGDPGEDPIAEIKRTIGEAKAPGRQRPLPISKQEWESMLRLAGGDERLAYNTAEMVAARRGFAGVEITR